MGDQKKVFVFKYRGKVNADASSPAEPEGVVDEARSLEEDEGELAADAGGLTADAGVTVLNLLIVDFEKRSLFRRQFKGSVLFRDFIRMLRKNNQGDMNILDKYADIIGEFICVMHERDTIHTKLNTTNMLLVENVVTNIRDKSKWFNQSNIYFVVSDYGHGYTDSSPEAKGEDLYILEKSINETHKDYPDLFCKIFEAYKSYSRSNISEIISKYEEIKMKGQVCPM